MAVIQKDIVVPDNLVDRIMNGGIDIMGLAKNSDNGRVIKHLDAYDSDNDNDSSEILGKALVVLTIAAFVGIGYGIYKLVHHFKVKHFKEALTAYVDAVNNKELTIDIINGLISALDKLKGRLRKKIVIGFSNEELTALIECLCNHTQTLADANNINLKCEPTEDEKNDVLLRLRNNLVKQRDIFELVA